MSQSPPERTPYKRGPNQSEEDYGIYLREFTEEQEPKAIYLDWLYTQDERDAMEYNAIHRRILRLILRFIDWLNSRMGATEHKPKRKAKRSDEQILYGHVPEWFEDEMMSRPENETECFYHPPINVSYTPHEWIDGKISGRRYGAWLPVEQMATFNELFEEKQEITE